MDRKPVTFPIETLHRLMICDAERGLLFWKERPVSMFSDTAKQTAAHRAAIWNGRNAGQQALCYLMTGGYVGGTILGKGNVRAHRVIWAMHTGEWPDEFLDHINGDRQDNCISNLREATLAQNHCNRAPLAGSSSQFLGVSWSDRNKGWVARIKSGGISQYLGTFRQEAQAALAYNAAAQARHGEFARLNAVGS